MCVAAGLTLFEIGSLFTRPETGCKPSDLEVICIDAREEAMAAPAHTVAHSTASSSGRTSPSAPASPTSGAFNTMSAGALPAVEECDSDADSGCIFNLSGGGEDRDVHEASPLMFAMTPCDGGDGADADADAGERPHGGARRLARLSDHTRFASFQFTTPVPQLSRESSDGHIAAPAPAQSASGVAVSQGPATWGRRGLPRARRNAWRSKHAGRNGVLGAYPPLLPGTHPDQVNYVFTDLTEAQWRVFLEFVEECVSEELANGTWKASRMTGPMAGSCPAAFNDRLR